MEKKSLLILVDNQGYYSHPIIDRLEFENFAGEIVRTFNEGDTLSTLLSSTHKIPGRKHFIVTDSLTASENMNDDDRSSGTYSMIKTYTVCFRETKSLYIQLTFLILIKKSQKTKRNLFTHTQKSLTIS